MSTNTDSNNHDLSTAIVPYNQSTYVVQVPKDQIFRVPPPENARIVEEHQNKIKNQKKGSSWFSCFVVILVILLVLVLLGLAIILIFYLVSNQGVPSFNVEKIVIIRPSSTKPEFDITMKSENPSATMKFFYESRGNVDLHHQGKLISSGDPPRFSIGRKGKTEIKFSLESSKARLPKEFNSSTKGAKGVVVPLSLSADFPMKLGFGILKMRNKDVGINCDVKVRKLATKLNVVSQNCKPKS